MASKPGWSKPSTILFASEIPANERAFNFRPRAGAGILLPISFFFTPMTRWWWPRLRPPAFATTITRRPHALRSNTWSRSPSARGKLASSAKWWCAPAWPPTRSSATFASIRSTGLSWELTPPDRLESFLWAPLPRPSFAQRGVPVFIVGPDVVDGAYRNFATRTILSAVSFIESSYVVATFAAELALHHNARLILQHVIRPQDRAEVLAGRTIEEIEADLLCLIPTALREQISIQTIVVPGDPTEELLYQSRAQQADLIVLGAHGASAFAAIARHGVVYKVLAHSHCPVITLSPAVLAANGIKYHKEHQTESFLAGVF